MLLLIFLVKFVTLPHTRRHAVQETQRPGHIVGRDDTTQAMAHTAQRVLTYYFFPQKSCGAQRQL